MDTLIARNRKTYKDDSCPRVNSESPREVVDCWAERRGKTTSFYIIVDWSLLKAARVLVDENDITRLPMYLRRATMHQLPAAGASIFRKLTVEKISWRCLRRSHWAAGAPLTPNGLSTSESGHIRTRAAMRSQGRARR